MRTNREAHEEMAGMGLSPQFFTFNNIDPDAKFDTKHDPDCDCGICQYCTGQEDVNGRISPMNTMKSKILEQIADHTPICCLDGGCGEVCEQNVMEAIELAYDKGNYIAQEQIKMLLGNERKAHDATSLRLLDVLKTLKRCHEAVSSLPDNILGMRQTDEYEYPLRDELLAEITNVCGGM